MAQSPRWRAGLAGAGVLAGRAVQVVRFAHLKLGWMVATGPTVVVSDALARLELIADTYLSVGTPVQLALPGLLQLVPLFAAKSSSVCSTIGAPCSGHWAQIRPALFCRQRLAGVRSCACRNHERRGLGQHPAGTGRRLASAGLFFRPGHGRHLVLSLIVQEQVFAEGVARLLARVGR